jgi:hypothetical protein
LTLTEGHAITKAHSFPETPQAIGSDALVLPRFGLT